MTVYAALLTEMSDTGIHTARPYEASANEGSLLNRFRRWRDGRSPQGRTRGASSEMLENGAFASFLAAGAVLFASLIVGSSGSLLVTGSDAMLAAIGQAFLSLGLKALGAGLASVALALAAAALWRRYHR